MSVRVPEPQRRVGRLQCLFDLNAVQAELVRTVERQQLKWLMYTAAITSSLGTRYGLTLANAQSADQDG